MYFSYARCPNDQLTATVHGPAVKFSAVLDLARRPIAIDFAGICERHN